MYCLGTYCSACTIFDPNILFNSLLGFKCFGCTLNMLLRICECFSGLKLVLAVVLVTTLSPSNLFTSLNDLSTSSTWQVSKNNNCTAEMCQKYKKNRTKTKRLTSALSSLLLCVFTYLPDFFFFFFFFLLTDSWLFSPSHDLAASVSLSSSLTSLSEWLCWLS